MKDRWEETLFHMAGREQMLMPQTLSDRIEEILCKPQKRDSRRFHMNWKKSIVLAAAMIMLISATAAASVGALRERMEAMNREKLEAYFTQIYASKIGVDNYNRAYSDAERARMTELREKYESEARFPEGEITMIERAEQYRGRGVAFLGDTSTFFFPEREMSDEELLRIIDFMHKRDYSLQKMNELIGKGEAQVPVTGEEIEATAEELLHTDAVYEPTQSLTIPYTGDLELDLTIAAGRNELFLAGYNSVHRMEIGSSDSEVFFDDFDEETRVLAMCQDQNGDLYMAVWELTAAKAENAPEPSGAGKGAEDAPGAEAAGDVDEGAVQRTLAVWVVDQRGQFLRKLDLSAYIDPDSSGMIRRMAIDGNGYLYLNTAGLRAQKENQECEILVLDREGGYVTRIAPDGYALRRNGGLGVGKDGRVYTYIEDYYDPNQDDTVWRRGIAVLDVAKGTLGEIYFDIMPENTSLLLDIVAPGAESDFVFWGYDGIFTYDLGDDKASCVLPPYEAPCDFEGVRCCALPDGRIVFADTSEYRTEEHALGKRFLAVPEKTCFYYVPGVGTEQMKRD